jgi:hypothetical protein
MRVILFFVAILVVFNVYGVRFGDIVFSELMVDPEPEVGLPSVEYVEIHNRSGGIIYTKNVGLVFGQKSYMLPDYELLPDSFLVLCSKNLTTKFPSGIALVGLTAFPALTNSGGTLALISVENEIVSCVNYSDSWYGSRFKSEGGWSLECRDPANFSGAASNWIASESPTGGTPGRRNSVDAVLEDTEIPFCDRFQLVASDTIELHFSKALQSKTSGLTTCYSISPRHTVVSEAKPSFPDLRSIRLVLSGALQSGVDYTLTLSGLTDVSGITLADTTLELGLPEVPTTSSWRINELLFNPKPGGCDYVEIVNVDDCWLSLSGLYLSSLEASGSWGKAYRISEYNRLCSPGSHWLLSVSKDSVCKAGGFVPMPYFADLKGFPSMPDEGGTLGLMTVSGEVLDRVEYSEKMHFVMISDKEGVALERRHPSFPSDASFAWASAASTVAYGTPGFRNSQYVEPELSTSSGFSIFQAWMTPDNDGKDDVVRICYNVESQSLCNLLVFDERGVLKKTLLRGNLLSSSGELQWDGTDSRGGLVPRGRYILYAEYFGPTGKVYKQKMVLAVLH